MVPLAGLLIWIGVVSTARIPYIPKFLAEENPAFTPRIIGGAPYHISEVPYQLALLVYDFHICGASILTSNFILTASHCIVGSEEDWPDYTVRAGSSINNSGGQLIKIKNFYPHKDYQEKPNWNNDIAILELASPIKFSDNAQPVGLPALGADVPIGKLGVVTGWGKTSEGGESTDQLRGVLIPINKPEVCESAYEGKFNRTTMICAADVKGGQSSCQGDSGGPLVVDDVQYGIVSWAQGCARPRKPTVFTHVANLRQFITDIVNI